LTNTKTILKEESAASVTLESGVIAIFPLLEKEVQRRSGFWKFMRAAKPTSRI
jgi:hypothetical protein